MLNYNTEKDANNNDDDSCAYFCNRKFLKQISKNIRKFIF